VLNISGVQVRETVPDWVMERVNEIVLADLDAGGTADSNAARRHLSIGACRKSAQSLFQTRQSHCSKGTRAPASYTCCRSQSGNVSRKRGPRKEHCSPRADRGLCQL